MQKEYTEILPELCFRKSAIVSGQTLDSQVAVKLLST